VTVKREFQQFLVEQRRGVMRDAASIVRAAPALDAGLRQVYDELHVRSIVVDDDGRVVAHYPPDVAGFQVRPLPGGGVELTRREKGTFESLRLKGGLKVANAGTVYFLTLARNDAQPRRSFRSAVDRWLLAGLGVAALLAVIVMLTIFRRVFAPVEALTDGARALAGGRLDARVAVAGNDEVAELGRAFNTMAEAVERNERARRNMVTDVAHELRTPLTNIRVQIEAAQDGVIDADAKFLASIDEEAATLARLVDDLQQLSIADAGQLRLEIAEVAVAEIIERAVSGVPMRGLTLTCDVPGDLVVRVDARRIVQVVRNLLVNATQYARSAIEVTASRVGDRVEIRVADDGPGVPDEDAERIFDRFHRADPSRSRTTGGAGLGLAIAKQLVELHGGTLRYERPAFVIEF
jgi:signal transduction histidine kinase